MKNDQITSIPTEEEMTIEEAILLSRGDVTIHDRSEELYKE